MSTRPETALARIDRFIVISKRPIVNLELGKTTIVIGQNENHTIHASASAMTRRLDVVVDNTPVFSQILPLGQSAKIQVGYTETHDVELKIGSWWKVHIWVDGVKKA